MMLGKLYWYSQSTDKAINEFKEAASILSITHGEDSTIMKELREMMEEAQREQSWKSTH
jgi:hypothetical protein